MYEYACARNCTCVYQHLVRERKERSSTKAKTASKMTTTASTATKLNGSSSNNNKYSQSNVLYIRETVSQNQQQAMLRNAQVAIEFIASQNKFLNLNTKQKLVSEWTLLKINGHSIYLLFFFRPIKIQLRIQYLRIVYTHNTISHRSHGTNEIKINNKRKKIYIHIELNMWLSSTMLCARN